MSIKKGYLVPHPPLLIPQIGDGLEKDIQATTVAYMKMAKEISEIKPETIIISSPHSEMYGDYFHISPGVSAKGDFSRFKRPDLKIEIDYDVELRDLIEEEISSKDFPGGTLGEKNPELDHGTMVPMFFINKKYTKYKIIRISLSGLSLIQHYKLGQIIRSVIPRKKKVVWIASGDLSHKLSKDGPYGFDSSGPIFDRTVTDVCRNANFYDLLKMKPEILETSSQCGIGSLIMMAGSFDGYLVNSKLLSYEGPFGVGYAVASFEPGHYSDEREFGRLYKERKDRVFRNKRLEEDEYVKLARTTLEHYIKNHHEPEMPKDLSYDLMNRKGSVFVSLHIDNNLRGCIGSLEPNMGSLAEEIIRNTISAATRDFRFSKVRENELKRIEYSIDILKTSEPIDDILDLDIDKYGLIVRSGNKSGVLLPNIEGIDSEIQQIRIAKKKAGIGEREKFTMERFEVERHH